MRKSLLFVVLIALALAAMAGTAYANYGIHGGYLQDTDACAGCHRAHTAFADITWTANDNSTHNALLVSSATSMSQFCYTCHGNGAPGAATNVQGGVLDTAISGNSQAATDQVGNTLNGGGFEWVRFGETSQTVVGSAHSMEVVNTLMWGSDTNAPVTWPLLSCNSCHDVHGSSNYRILRDTVNNYTVGGYIGFTPSGNQVANPTPNPWVLSSEIGYPNGSFGRDTGFRLHVQNVGYQPDYTNAVYHVPPDRNMTGATIVPGVAKGMTGWCIACHETYGTRGLPSGGPDGAFGQLYTVGGLDDTGSRYRHKHPVNTPLSAFDGPRGLVIDPYVWYSGWNDLYTSGYVTVPPVFVDLPVLHDPALDGREGRYSLAMGVRYNMTDGLDCLTCHRAHGSEATMTGFANSSSNASPAAGTGFGGVPPTNDGALLRANNRGVCERCHNK